MTDDAFDHISDATAYILICDFMFRKLRKCFCASEFTQCEEKLPIIFQLKPVPLIAVFSSSYLKWTAAVCVCGCACVFTWGSQPGRSSAGRRHGWGRWRRRLWCRCSPPPPCSAAQGPGTQHRGRGGAYTPHTLKHTGGGAELIPPHTLKHTGLKLLWGSWKALYKCNEELLLLL